MSSAAVTIASAPMDDRESSSGMTARSPVGLDLAAYRIVQEALTNAIKQRRARRRARRAATLAVEVDGPGPGAQRREPSGGSRSGDRRESEPRRGLQRREPSAGLAAGIGEVRAAGRGLSATRAVGGSRSGDRRSPNRPARLQRREPSGGSQRGSAESSRRARTLSDASRRRFAAGIGESPSAGEDSQRREPSGECRRCGDSGWWVCVSACGSTAVSSRRVRARPAGVCARPFRPR